MGIALILVASCFSSLSNFCMRRSIDSGGTAKTYLAVQLSIAALAAIFLGPIRTGEYALNGPVAVVGIAAGLILGGLFVALGRSLEKGPPGLTFALLNASTVVPAVVMALLFGAAYGCIYTPWHALGSLFVLGGLFWAGKGLQGLIDMRSWLFFIGVMFCLHVLFLVLMQSRVLILSSALFPETTLSRDLANPWFLFFIYLAAAAVQIAIYLISRCSRPKSDECFYSLFGGTGNALSTFFLIWATEAANSLERAVLFPIFSIAIIIICNLWGQKLYQEKVNWKACHLCLLGLFIGTVDWNSLLALF